MNKKVQLSHRLQAVVNLVTPGYSVADIGCDHAYISIYMVQEGIAGKVIAMDVNRGPLERAKENIEKYGYLEQIETRLSDGIQALNGGEVHTLLIAGMGGPLMQQILRGNPSVVEQVEELVLQPQSEISEVRRFVEALGFQILEEEMLMEDGKYYTMFRAERVPKVVPWGSELFYRYGKELLEKKNSCLRKYLEREKEKCRNIRNAIEQNPSPKGLEKLRVLEEDITYCEEALAYYECRTDY